MPSSLAIGDFSRATHLTIKTLRHYHRIGLLEPAQVDPGTGHRRYGTDQIPTAQVIKRFRSLDMPLEEIHAIVFVPCAQAVRATGLVVPEVELALATHDGAHNGVDVVDGSLAAYVTDHALAVEGPIREYYVVGPHETADENQWRTETGWPIFHTGLASG